MFIQPFYSASSFLADWGSQHHPTTSYSLGGAVFLLLVRRVENRNGPEKSRRERKEGGLEESGVRTALVAAAAVINGHLNPGPSFDYTRIRENNNGSAGGYKGGRAKTGGFYGSFAELQDLDL